MTSKKIEKLYARLKKDFTDEEIAEGYLFPPVKRSKKEQEQLDREFGEHLARLRQNRTAAEKQAISMFQLKLQMQDYVQSTKYDNEKSFGYYLGKYIQMLEKKNKDFAKDISITPVELSQLLNNHRNPNIKILIRLELHSNNGIPAYLWFKVLEKEKEHDIVNNKEIRKQELKYVRNVVKLAS